MQCLLCRKGVETVEHGWRCEATEWTAQVKRQEVIKWLDDRICKGMGGAKVVREAVYDLRSLVIWASGTPTEEMGVDHLSV